MNKYIRLMSILCAGFVLAFMQSSRNTTLAESTPLPPLQNNILVNTLEDENNSDGDCSLREAINAANSNIPTDACAGGSGSNIDTITFALSGTISLNSTLNVTGGGPLKIDGEGKVTISGNSNVGVFIIYSATDVTISRLTISGGYQQQSNGGAFYNYGTLTITNSILAANTAAFGGAVFNANTMSISNSTISGNYANTYGGQGGGIYNSSSLIISNSFITGNSSFWDGGGIYNGGYLTIIQSTLSGNHTSDGFGAAINNLYGVVNISNSTLSENNAWWYGGGISNSQGSITISDSTISNNISTSGSAVSNYQGTATIINSTFSGNVANSIYGYGYGGAIWNDSTLTMDDSTLSGNSALTNGGGIYNEGTLSIDNSTLSGNSADALGGGIYNTIVSGGHLSISSSVIAYSVNGSNCGGDPIIDDGYNLEDTNTCNFNPANGSLPNTDPLLGPLQDNGGPTFTHALLEGSPAIDAGFLVGCPPPATDQRGMPRPMDGDGDGTLVCDMGSYEYFTGTLSTSTSITADLPDPSSVGQLFTTTVNVTSTFGTPTGMITVTITDNPESCSAILENGAGTCSLSLNNTGTYTLTAEYGGNDIYLPSNDTEQHTVVLPANSSTAITSDDPDPSLPGQPFLVDFAVTSESGVPTGMVTVTITDNPESCSAILVNGVGACSLSLNNTGTYTLTAEYGGDDAHLPSNGTDQHTVVPANSSTAITSDDPDPSLPGQPFVVGFAVTSESGVPTGMVTVTVSNDDASCTGVLVDGVGTCSLSLTSPGSYTLTAAYNGDNQHAPSASPEEQHAVNLLKLFLPIMIR